MRRNEPDVLIETPDGLFCPAGDFFIDPWNPVARAVITHAHSDHARIGNGHYLAAQQAERVLRTRLGGASADGGGGGSGISPAYARFAAPGKPPCCLVH